MNSENNILIRETTQASLSHYIVGVSNIWVRDLPDQQGIVKPRLSANVSLFDLNIQDGIEQKVFLGSVIDLGDVKYHVVDVSEGSPGPGWITLQMII